MKKNIIFLLVLLAGLNVYAQGEQETQKIGFVDSQVILNQFPEAIKAQSDLDAMIANWNNIIDSMTTELQKAYSDYQKQEATMTPTTRQQTQQEIILKEQEITQYRQLKFGQNGGISIEELRMARKCTGIVQCAGKDDVGP